MINYFIDITNCETDDELHQVLKDRLDLPDYYGMNPDALWDCLTRYIEVPATITLRGVSQAKKDIQDELQLVLRVIERASRMYGEIVLFVED